MFQPAQFTAQQVVAIFKRRRRLLILPMILVTGLCVLGAFLMPRKYESATTILVQKDEILNPLVSYTIAVTMTSDDRLRTFNEITYSQHTIQVLIDSLKLAGDNKIITEAERQELVKRIRDNIQTERPGSASFRIAYLDTDPVRAQQAVLLLSHLFIKTLLQVENQRNEMAVQFFEGKLLELRGKFEDSQREVISLMRKRIQDMPGENSMIYSRLEDTEDELREADRQMKTYQQGLVMLRRFPEIIRTEEGKRIMHQLANTTLPYASELRSLVIQYDEYIRRYTPKYPEVAKLTFRILDLLTTMRSTVENELSKHRGQRLDVERQRVQLVEDLKSSSVIQTIDADKQSSYDIYQKLYDEMKIKLEQARTNRDLGRTSKDQFIIIDPPVIPTEPSKPNRLLIIFAGFVLGTILGVVTVGTSELLDTKVRTKRDVDVYQKPIIAFIPEGHIIVDQ